MISIVLVKYSVIPTNFETDDLDEPLKSGSFNCLYSFLSKFHSFKDKVPSKRNIYIKWLI